MLLFIISAPPVRRAVITKVEQLIIHTHPFTLLQFIRYARPLRYRYVYEHITIIHTPLRLLQLLLHFSRY